MASSPDVFNPGRRIGSAEAAPSAVIIVLTHEREDKAFGFGGKTLHWITRRRQPALRRFLTQITAAVPRTTSLGCRAAVPRTSSLGSRRRYIVVPTLDSRRQHVLRRLNARRRYIVLRTIDSRRRYLVLRRLIARFTAAERPTSLTTDGGSGLLLYWSETAS